VLLDDYGGPNTPGVKAACDEAGIQPTGLEAFQSVWLVDSKCRCGSDAEPLHECPFKMEIHSNSSLCNCCEGCARECAMDI
jgi:hypothetical protein